MGTNTLFDKSFLQSLTVDESMWFDNFFRANVCPLFYLETLGDLDKKIKGGRSPEEEVRIIADKFPEMRGQPTIFHHQLCIENLMGRPVLMTGQMYLPRARYVQSSTEITAIVKEAPEAEAFRRWQTREFSEIEKRLARIWRNKLLNMNLEELAVDLETIGIDSNRCKTIEEAKKLAETVWSASDYTFQAMKIALRFFDIPQEHQGPVLNRWASAGYPTLADFAPYSTHVLTVELFFRIALAANLISAKRSSNKVDIAYLFYLPFCTIFVSSDRLHEKCVPLFLRHHQEFIRGDRLKKGLKELNEFYLLLPEERKKRGVMKFAVYPPKDKKFIVTQLWDRHVPGWRRARVFSPKEWADAESRAKAKIQEAISAPEIPIKEMRSDLSEDSLVIQRRFKIRKGSWWQAPEDFDPGKKE
jgi:hypothetical protein